MIKSRVVLPRLAIANRAGQPIKEEEYDSCFFHFPAKLRKSSQNKGFACCKYYG
jgi:hypothetical protein